MTRNNHTPPTPVTRGNGLLEPILARLRTNKANSLIRESLRHGRILDIGGGSYPYFLTHTYFNKKYAIDQLSSSVPHLEIQWHQLNLNEEPFLPFADEFFSTVTMLAVVEHLNPDRIVILFSEIYRVLQPGGLLVITTPAAWSNSILNWMASLHLVSPEEIKEHVYMYTLPLLGWYFGRSGFEMKKVRFGYFELFMNMWATAEK